MYRHRIMNLLTFLTLALTYFVSSESQIDPRDCPLQCTCTGYAIECTSIYVFPENLPEVTQEFRLSDSEIKSIPSNVFLNLYNLTIIDIKHVSIQKVMACAFAELEGVSIYFNDVDIEVMEGNSFSNIANSFEIVISDSTIQEMASFAFHNIQNVGVVEFINTEIGTIHPYAFRHVRNVTDFSLRNSSVDQFLKEAFSRFYDVEYVYILRSTIKNWQCGSVNIFSESGEDIFVSASSLACDCSLAWLWKMHPNSSIIHTGSNRCYTSDFMLTDLEMNDICDKEERQMTGCPQLLPTTPHTCSRVFDTPYMPEEKVEYPKSFSRKPDDSNFSTKLCTSAVLLMSCVLTGFVSRIVHL